MDEVLDRIEQLLVMGHYYGLTKAEDAEMEMLYALKDVMIRVQNGWNPK